MESQTKAVWDFMEIAYRKGLLDEFLELVGYMISPEADLSELLATLEDRGSEMDLGAIDEILGEMLVLAMRALSDEDVVEGLKVLLTTTRPLIEGVMRAAGGDTNVIMDMAKGIGKSILSLKPVVLAIAPVVSKMASPYIEGFFKEKGGQILGSGINLFCALINRINEKDPSVISGFMSGLFDVVDSDEARKTADTLVGSFLDQRPSLVGWAAATLVTRVKKRLIGLRGGM
jgi:hypothetical protein